MIEQLVAKTFALRDCAHYAHWATSSGYHHEVLGEVYSEVVKFVDRLMEAYIGNSRYGLRVSGGTRPSRGTLHRSQWWPPLPYARCAGMGCVKSEVVEL